MSKTQEKQMLLTNLLPNNFPLVERIENRRRNKTNRHNFWLSNISALNKLKSKSVLHRVGERALSKYQPVTMYLCANTIPSARYPTQY